MKAVILAWLLLGVSAPAAVPLTDAQRDWLNTHGKLVFAAAADYPPYTFAGGDGQPRGLDADVARAVGRLLGVEVEVRSLPWPEALRQTHEGQADALAGMVQSDDRREAWAFVEPHADVQYFLFVREDTHTIHELKDLEGMRVGVGQGSLVEPILRANPKITVVNYGRGEGMEELLGREISAFAGNLVVQSHFIETRNIRGIKVVGTALMPALPYGMGAPRGHDELLGILNAAVAELKSQGELSALQRKWFGDLLRPPLISRRQLRWLWTGLAILAGATGLGVLRSWELRRMVQRKTARISALRALGHSFGEARDVAGVLDRAMDVLDPLLKPDPVYVVAGKDLIRHVRLPAALQEELKTTGGVRVATSFPIVAEGQTLGTFGVVSARAQDTDFLRAVAAELGIAVANAALFATLEQRVAERTAELNARNQQLEADLSMAREVQVALQPWLNSSAVEIARHDGEEPISLTLWNRSSTARTVGGDFVSILRTAPGSCSVFICDVMGQGARAALLTAIVRTVLDELSEEPRDAQRFMTDLNRRLTSMLRTQSSPIFATALYVCFDLATRQITYANAGHPWPLVIRRAIRRIEMIDEGQPHGPALGVFDDAEFPQLTRRVHPGDVWLLYTEQLARPLSEVLDHLMRDLARFSGHEEVDDDICLVALEADHAARRNPSA
jgi:ABC-type amino acid transport substrate-binding protein/serine phosphatase RsbU (regulator of sigma subunit)